jgi:hypothetical protein
MVKACPMNMNVMNTNVELKIIPLGSYDFQEISSLQLKKSYKKGCQIFVVQMEETPKNKVPNIEDFVVLKKFENVFK